MGLISRVSSRTYRDSSRNRLLILPLLTDFYQVTMVYSYWKGNRTNDNAVFELYFRKNPFKGEYTVFGGLDEVLDFLSNFKFTENDIDYVKSVLPNADPKFYKYLENLDTSKLTVESLKPGTVCFPRVPLLTVSG